MVRGQSSGCRGTLWYPFQQSDCFLCIAGYRPCLVERALCVVGFTCSMAAECLKVCCAAGLTILFGIDDHGVTTCDSLAYLDWFEDT